MPASTREVYLLLRARDEASRIVRGFSSELMRSAAAAQAAALRADAVSKRQEASAARAEGASRARVLGILAAAKAMDVQAKAIMDNERRNRAFSHSLSAVASSIETVGIASVIAGGLVLAFLFDSAKQWAEYERQVALTRTQIDGFAASMQQVSDIGLDIARRIPVAFEQLQPALFDIFSSTNANLNQARILLEAFSKAAVAGQTDVQTAARGTIAIMNAYNIPFENVNKVLDIQFELVRKGVGTYEEFAAVFGRVVPSATRAGQSFETVAAILAFMTRNGTTAAMAASSASRAMEALANPKTVARLADMGIKVQDAQGHFIPLIDTLTQLRKKILEIPPADRVKALSELFASSGGTIQARRFLDQILLREGDLENFRDLLGSMADASGVMEDKFGEMSDTAAAKMQLLSNRFMVLRLSIGEAAAPVLLVLVELLSKVVEAFNNLSPATKRTIAQFLIWGSVLAVVGGAILIFVGFIAAVTAAVMTAGSALLVVVGILAGLGAVVGSVATLFYTLWTRSEDFRKALQNLGKVVSDFWKEHFEPTWNQVSKIIDERVLPAIDRLHEFLGSKLAVAINLVSDMIKNVLGPALEKALDWYLKNKETVDKVVGALAIFVAALAAVAAIVIAVFVGLLGGTVVAALVGFISMLMLAAGTVTLLVDGISAAVDWITTNWPKAWAAVVSFFKDAWNAIASFFSEVWQRIVAAITVGLEFLGNLWQTYWDSTFGKYIKAIWDLIVSIVQLGMAATTAVILFALDSIRSYWTAIWTGVQTVAAAVWGAIVSFFTSTWGMIVAVWNDIWGSIGGTVTESTSGIWNTIRNAWNSVASFTTNTWNSIYATVYRIATNMRSFILGVMTGIRDFFVDAGSWLYDAGKNIITGLIEGITSKIKAITDKVKEVTKIITDHFPQSPAKRGPLSGSGSPFKLGQNITRMLADGMLYHSDQVAAASAQLASQVMIPGQFSEEGVYNGYGPRINAPVVLGQSPGGASTTVNDVSITVNTQEIDPRTTATQLGWELAGRLS